MFSFFLRTVILKLYAGARLSMFNNNNNNNNNINSNNKNYTYKLSPYFTLSSSLYFCDKCGLEKADSEARNRVQLILYRPLNAIFEEVVGKLGSSMININKRHRDIFKFLRAGIFARHALFCNRFLRQMCTPKT